MALAPEEIATERRRLAGRVLELLARYGEEVTLPILAREEGISRNRLGQIFADEDEVTEAVAELWLEPHVQIMEEVMDSDLPPNRKMYEFIVRRFRLSRERFKADPATFALLCELGTARYERIRSVIDLADHYLCELIAEAQADGYLAGLEIDQALSLINQMVTPYTIPDMQILLGDRLHEEKLARIVDAIFAGLNGGDSPASGVKALRLVPSEA